MFVCFSVSSVFFSHLHSCCFLVLVLCFSGGCLLCMLCFLHELFPLICLLWTRGNGQKFDVTHSYLLIVNITCIRLNLRMIVKVELKFQGSKFHSSAMKYWPILLLYFLHKDQRSIGWGNTFICNYLKYNMHKGSTRGWL